MGTLRIALAVNGLVFLLRALINVSRPRSFYAEDDAPPSATDAVHAVGIAYGTIGLSQLGQAQANESAGLRVMAQASLLFALAMAVKAATLRGAPRTEFQRLRWVTVLENGFAAVLYGALLHRAR